MSVPSCEFVAGVPHPRLRPFVSEYGGYRLVGFDPGVHAGLPSRSLTMVVSFENPVELATAVGSEPADKYWGLLGGLHRAPALIHHQGRQHGVQLKITPRGAAALFDVPAAQLASSVIHLEEVDPQIGSEIIERLSAARSWRARWAVLDDIFLRILHEDREMPIELERAWSILQTADGGVAIADLAADIGWSRRRFAVRFKQSYGLSPKVMARVMRFERAQHLLRLPTQPSLSSVAMACGYADQAHMTREWNEFAGSSPTKWLSDEAIPFVQDQDVPPMSS